jgi:TonB family protein
MRLLGVLLGLLIPVLAQDFRELLNQGVQAYKSARYSDAAQIFQKLVEANPNDVMARLYLGTAIMSQYIPETASVENLEIARRAEAEFQEALRIDPNDKTALASLASLTYREAQGMPDLSQKLRKLDESKSWYVRAIAVDPQDKTAYYSLGVIDWVKWYAAWMQTRANLGMRPESPGPMQISGVRDELARQYSAIIEDGIANLQKALAIDPQYSDAMAYMNLLIRERADLHDTPEEYSRDVALANQWVQKAVDAKNAQGPSPAPGTSSFPQRIRVGGNVQQANLIRKINPVYPFEAKQARIEGAVRFTTIIGKDGSVQNLTLISGHPLLVEAAREVVQQWQYKPTLLNGQPVEVVTQIDVNFTLQP